MIRLHANAVPESLGFCRIVVFGLWMILLLRSPLQEAAVFPVDWFVPRGPFLLLPEAAIERLLEPDVLWSVQVLLVSLCAALVLGVRPFMPTAFAFGFLLVVHDGVMKGFCGYSNHAQFCLLYAAWLMALFPAADGLSIMGRKGQTAPPLLYSAPLMAIPFVICIAYMLIGVRRFVVGGFGIFLDDSIATYVAARSLEYSEYSYEVGLLVLSVPACIVILKVGYFITTLFEALSPICIINRAFRLTWLVVIVPFHVITLLTMNIFFWENLVLIAVFFTALPHWVAARAGAPSRAGEGYSSDSV